MAQSVVGRTIIQGATTVGGFNPASLFASGEQGAWYDPSDLTTMYSVMGGPVSGFVTALESPISVIMDKSKTLFVTTGAQLVSNGGPNFVNTTGWTQRSGASGSASVVSGKLRVDTGLNAFGGVNTPIATVVGKVYYVSASASLVSGTGVIRLYKCDDNAQTVNVVRLELSSPIISFFVATSTTTYIALSADQANTVYDWDYVSVKEVQGNSASQNTAANRPVVSARVNLLTYSQQFDNAVWTKGANLTLTQNTTGTVDPLGTNTAAKVVENAGTTGHAVSQRSLTVPGAPLTFSLCAKASGYNYIIVQFSTDPAFTKYFEGVFNLSTGVVESTGRAVTFTGSRSITNLGNGWYRCTITVDAADANSTSLVQCVPAPTNDPTNNYNGDGVSGAYIWGADLRPTNQGVGLPPYQRVGAATYGTGTTAGVADYDANGFPYYLKFDGAASYMSLPNSAMSNLQNINQPVFMSAGARRETTSAGSIFSAWGNELSGGNNDCYNFVFFSATNQVVGSVRIYNGSITDKNAAVGSLSAPASAVSSWAKSSSTGYVTYNGSTGTSVDQTQEALTLFYYNLGVTRRGSDNVFSSYLAGNIYGLIIRVASTTANQITATENWLNQKTKAF